MTYTPTPEAVEAAARAMADDWNPDRDPILSAMFRDYALSALTAAGPIIAAEVREQVAEEVEREADRRDPVSTVAVGLRLAARIARGEGS